MNNEISLAISILVVLFLAVFIVFLVVEGKRFNARVKDMKRKIDCITEQVHDTIEQMKEMDNEKKA
jgi:uncharacterized protein YoxC